jgi:2,3-bisphosphoglycerate-independent phosphoglycerate mutase
MVYGHGFGTEPAPDASSALAAAYGRGENDEFVKPTLIDGIDGRVRDGDVVIHFNFRADRARQLTHALVDAAFDHFDRGPNPPFPTVVTLTEYESGLPVQVAYPPMVETSLAEVVSGLGWKQFHVAETEKYAHVTYFMNGGVEKPWPGEDRKLVPSPKVATYDLQPEMSAAGVTDAIVAAVESGEYDLIIANFANPDMVGHTGVWDATVEACTFLDGCLGRVADAVLAADAKSVAEGGAGALLAITADHGNADVMIDAAGKPVTKHSLSPVPFLLAGSVVQGRSLVDGVLADVAPTLMALTGVELAEGMSGHDLLED